MARNTPRASHPGAYTGRFSLAEAGMMGRILWRAVSARRFWILVCMLGAMACLAYGLGEIVRDAATSLLLPAVLAGALIGYGMATSRLKGWQAGGLGVILGAGGIFFRVANLAVPTAGLISTIPNFCAQVILWLQEKLEPDFSFQQFFLADFAQRASGLAVRLYTWGYGIWQGNIANDPASRAVSWALVIWLFALWAGWTVGKRKNAITAFAPALALLALVNDYALGDPTTVLLMLACVLLLLGIQRYDTEEHTWKKKRVDFSESTSTDTTLALVGVAFLLTSLAWLTPSVSVREMIDQWREYASRPNTVAESLGVKPPPRVASQVKPYVQGGLPRSHLLGAGPELEKIIVFTVQTGELPPIPQLSDRLSVPRYYWRSIVYDNYLGSGWSTSQTEDEGYPANTDLLPVEPLGYKLVRQSITRYQDGDTRIYFTGTLQSADQPFTVAWRSKPGVLDDPIAGADMFGGLVPAGSYSATSYVAQASEKQLRAAPASIPEAIRARYTRLPEIPERVLALARDLTASAPTPYDQAIAIQNYLRANYPYTLDLPAPPAGRDVADYFLFELKEGYCDYYATSMVILARSAGLPARMVSGYATGVYDASRALYVVREINAHSWVEIYFAGIGWVEFEPTAAYASFSPMDEYPVQMPPNLPAEQETVSWLEHFWAGWGKWASSAGLILAGILVLLFAAQWIEQAWLASLPDQQAAQVIFRGMERFGEATAGPGVGKETPYEFASRLKDHLSALSQRKSMRRFFQPARQEIDSITSLYIGAVFSPHAPSTWQVRQTARAWRKLRLRLALGRIVNMALKANKRKTTL